MAGGRNHEAPENSSPTSRNLVFFHYDPPQQAGPGANVPRPIAKVFERPAIVPVAGAAARHAADRDDVVGETVGDVVADLVLDGRVAADVGADLGEYLVPRPADLPVEVAAERVEAFVQSLGPPAMLGLPRNRRRAGTSPFAAHGMRPYMAFAEERLGFPIEDLKLQPVR